MKSRKIISFMLSAIMIISMAAGSVITAEAEGEAETTISVWDFETYVREGGFASDTPISEKTYGDFPYLEFNIDSAKPNCWNTYNKQYGIALYSQNSGNYIKYTPMQSGVLSLTAYYKKIDNNQRWLSVDMDEPSVNPNKIFDLQTDDEANKVTSPQTRTIDLKAGTTYYIHGNNIIFTKMEFEGSGEIITPSPSPTPELKTVSVDTADMVNSTLKYSVSVNYEGEYDLYTAVYNSESMLCHVSKNKTQDEIKLADGEEYKVKAMLWEKDSMKPIKADEKTAEDVTLRGKTVYAFGDSIVYGHTDPNNAFMNLLSADEGMFLKKYAVNGATVVKGSNDIISQLGKAPTEEPDFIVFDGYTNDAYEPILDAERLGEPQGSAATSFDNSTFCGAFEEIIYTMKQKWPNAKIIFVTIHKSAGRDWDIQCALREKTMEMCADWGVSVADVFNDAALDTRNADEMKKYIIGGKGSHPNVLACREFYVPILKKTLKSACAD